MLHEIILSLSGHPSPLLTTDSAARDSSSILSPPEKALLSSIAHLSDIHCKLLLNTKEVSSTHASSICQAVSASIKSTHLVKFQEKVLEVEIGILRKDAGSVGAYNIVPLTAVVGQFSEWVRRMEWLCEITHFMMQNNCTGALLIDKLCDAVQTGYTDIEEIVLHLIKVAETAWLKQASTWILYGRLPSFGKSDFFIHEAGPGEADDYMVKPELLPLFVDTSCAASIFFIGRSLKYIRVKGISLTGGSLGLLPKHLELLSVLSFPISTSSLSRTISAIRMSLAQNALQQLLPLNRIREILSLLHEFFLLGRGEFAIALISEADEKSRSRWRRSDNLAYSQRDRVTDVIIKDGEVSAVLARTWAAMSSVQGMTDDDEDILDLARDLIQLNIVKSSSSAPSVRSPLRIQPSHSLVTTAFNSLLLSVPTNLTLQIPSPLDLFLTPADVHIYTIINSYLLSIRRAHLRLTDLWKISSLRRHHPAPPAPPYGSSVAGLATVKKLRMRAKARGQIIRGVWATGSAALFLLGETETYFLGEVVKGTWTGFRQWLMSSSSRPATATSEDHNEDIWAAAAKPKSQDTTQLPTTQPSHDPQTLSEAHRRYLDTLAHNLLLTTPTFTTPLYYLLQQIDHLVALVNRMHSIWHSLDLEADEGVVDAFSDFHKEEKDVEGQLSHIAARVKQAIEALIHALRDIDQEKDTVFQDAPEALFDELAYVPRKVGRVDRLLMKLDFGTWFDVPHEVDEDREDDALSDEE